MFIQLYQFKMKTSNCLAVWKVVFAFSFELNGRFRQYLMLIMFFNYLVLQVLALESVDVPGRVLLLANTHLYFHPDAGHIRMIQIITAMRFIEKLMQLYKKQVSALILLWVFCSQISFWNEWVYLNHVLYKLLFFKLNIRKGKNWLCLKN